MAPQGGWPSRRILLYRGIPGPPRRVLSRYDKRHEMDVAPRPFPERSRVRTGERVAPFRPSGKDRIMGEALATELLTTAT